MGLPDRDSAKEWGGKLLVDRDGTSIGTCTEIFLDDATGQPEWATADVSGGPVFVPLLDAAEAGGSVRVAVRQADVAEAPSVAAGGHLSPDEEEQLYRHYGIEFSREASESLLPVGNAPVPPQESTPTSPAPAPTKSRKGQALRALAAGLAGLLAVVAAALVWRRRNRPMPATRKEQLSARARTASVALAARGRQVATTAAPLLKTGRELSAKGAQQAAVRARAAAEVAAQQAAVQARAARQQAAALTAAAKAAKRPRITWRDDVVPAPVPVALQGRQVRDTVLDAVKGAAGFAAGYAVRARTAGSRLAHGEGGEQLLEPTKTSVRRTQIQEAAGKVRARVSDGLQAGNTQLTRRAGEVTEKVRRRSGSSSDGDGTD